MPWMWIAGTGLALVAVLFVLTACRRPRPVAVRGRFPSAFRRLRGLRPWSHYRPEGRSIAYTLCAPWRILFYLWKYFRPTYVTAPDELAYFNRQRALLRAMRGAVSRMPAGGACVRLAAVGDIMWVRTNWDHFLNPNVRERLLGFDVVLGNLETPVDPRSPPSAWYQLDAGKFNSDPRLLTAFNDPATGRTPFTALSLANNHVFDRGDGGARRTMEMLDRMNILHSGVRLSADRPSFATFERAGIRFGFHAAAYGYNQPRYRSDLVFNRVSGLAPEPQRAEDVDLGGIEEALAGMERAGAEFRILYLHWGHEYELYPTPVQVQLGRKLAAMGFDLVVGNHPHVVQPSEVCFVNGYERVEAGRLGGDLPALTPGRGCAVEGSSGRPRKSLIHYSLGNFTTAMLFGETQFGAIQTLRVFRDPETGAVDWEAPDFELVYNLLTIHNGGRKEMTLLAPYVCQNEERLRNDFPRRRRIAGYLHRHLSEPMTRADLRRGPTDADFDRLADRCRRTGAPGNG